MHHADARSELPVGGDHGVEQSGRAIGDDPEGVQRRPSSPAPSTPGPLHVSILAARGLVRCPGLQAWHVAVSRVGGGGVYSQDPGVQEDGDLV